MHGNTADVIATNLALAGVQPGAHLDAEYATKTVAIARYPSSERRG
jgi:hypothetical protein